VPGRGRGRASTLAVRLVVAVVGSGGDMAPGEMCRRLSWCGVEGWWRLAATAVPGQASGAVMAFGFATSDADAGGLGRRAAGPDPIRI
jgi:hypothetical protein